MNSLPNRTNKRLLITPDVLVFTYLLSLTIFDFTPVYLAAVALLVAGILIRGSLVRFDRAYVLWQLFYITFLLFHSLTISVNKTISLRCLQTIVLNFCISIVICQVIKDRANIERLFEKVPLIAVISSVFIILYSRGRGYLGRLGHRLPRVFFPDAVVYNSIDFSMYAVYGTLCCMYLYYKRKQKKYLLPILFFGIVVLLCGSRKGMLSFLMDIIIFSFLVTGNSLGKKLKRILLGTLLVLGAYFVVMEIPLFYSIIGYRFEGAINVLTGNAGVSESSANTRNSLAVLAYQMFLEKPFTGWGLDTYKTVSLYNIYSHNNYLEMLVSGGIPLFVLYYIFILTTTIKLWKAQKKGILFKLLFTILFSIIIFDYVSMSYLSRLSQFFIAISSYSLYLESKAERAEGSYTNGSFGGSVHENMYRNSI